MSRTDRNMWEEFLRETDAQLSDIEAAIELGDTLPSFDFTPPANLPPLPPECADQAASLSEKNQALASTVSTILAELPPPPRRKRPATAPSRTPGTARFDVSA